MSIAQAAGRYLSDPDSYSSWPELLRLPFRELVDGYLEAASGSGGAKWLRDLASERIDALFREEHEPLYRLEAQLEWSPGDVREPLSIQTAIIQGWDEAYQQLSSVDATAVAGALDVRGVVEQLPHQRDLQRELQSLSRELQSLRRTVVSGSISLYWPMPSHSTCWGYEHTSQRLAESDQRWSQQDEPDSLFGSWVQTMTTILKEALPSTTVSTQAETGPGTTWEEVRGQLDALLEGSVANAWRVQVWALCTPEMGMSNPENVWPREPMPEEATSSVAELRSTRNRGLPSDWLESLPRGHHQRSSR